jgi:hypothetical protein
LFCMTAFVPHRLALVGCAMHTICLRGRFHPVQLVHRPVQAALEPPLVQAQPVQGLVPAIILREHPTHRVRRIRVHTSAHPLLLVVRHLTHEAAQRELHLLGQQVIEQLIGECLGPLEPPGETDDPLG